MKASVNGRGISYVIKKYGSPVIIGDMQAFALLRPLRKTRESGEEYWCASESGRFEPGLKVQWGEKHLIVMRGDAVFLGGERLYNWAILREEKGALCAG